MAKILKTVGSVASLAAMVPGPQQPFVAAFAQTAQMYASILAHAPHAVGQVQGVLVGANNPLPYLMGEAYTEGVELYRVGYGGTVSGVVNPYAFIPRVLSCCGPIQSMGTTQVDHADITLTGAVGTVQPVATGGYYENFLWIDQQLGTRPESTALGVPAGWGTPTGWSAAHKLSGMAAVGWSLTWDKKGTRFAGGSIPPLGKIAQGVKVYDPRLDSTFSGGSGAHRVTDESTWTYSANPALHAGVYAYGRKVNGVSVFGGRLFDAEGIDFADVVAWANACDANGWTVNGTIYEPDDKWNNLKRICEAGGGIPVLRGGVIGFDFQAPRTSLYTITRDDLVSAPVSGRLGKGWKERHNTLVPRYRSAAHQWNYVQAAAVVDSAFLSADGQEKSDERQWDLVTDKDQVTELAIYDLWQRREGGPFSVVCKPHMRIFGPGDCLTLSAELGLHPSGTVVGVVRERSVDPETGAVALTLEQETAGKHTAALGATGGAPAVPTLPTSSALDQAWFTNAVQDLYAGADRALVGLNSDGTVASSKVTTISIVPDAVTAPFIVSTGVQVLSLSSGTLQTVTGLSFSATIPSGEVLDLDLLTFPLWSGNDGTRFSLDAYLLRDGTAVASFGQVMDTNDMATSNQGGFAVPVGLFARVAGNGASSTYSVQLQLLASVSESNSGGSKSYSAPLDFRLRSSQLRGRRYSR